MTAPGYGFPPSPAGERWKVNFPAVVGVIFAFLVGVIVWVIASGGDDTADAPDRAPAGTTPVADNSLDDTTATTSPAPMPSTTAAASTTSSTTVTSAPTTSAVPDVTAAPAAGPDAVAGDLGVPGRPMQRPGCDGAYITILASAIGAEATAGGIANVLEAYPGSNYLRTDQTCPSLRPDVGGEPIYVVYFGPFAFDTDACAARADGPDGAYARILSTDLAPDHGVPCG
jgi:serine/threonine-protein kinase